MRVSLLCEQWHKTPSFCFCKGGASWAGPISHRRPLLFLYPLGLDCCSNQCQRQWLVAVLVPWGRYLC